MTRNPHRTSPQQREQRERVRTQVREDIRSSLNNYLDVLKAALAETPRGSGHAVNEYDHLQACITQTLSAKRVMWFED